MGILIRPVVNQIKLNDVDRTSDLLPYLQKFTITKYLTEKANLLSIYFILPQSLNITGIDPQIYNTIQIFFNRLSSGASDVDTGICTIDNNDIRIFENTEYVGGQGYNFFKGLINSQGNQTSADEFTATIGLTKNITIGGEVGADSGEYTLLEMFNIIADRVNADLVVNGYVGFGNAGWSDSRSLKNGVDGDSYGEILDKLSKAYGYLYIVKPPITPGKAFTIELSRYNSLITLPVSVTINKDDIISQSKITYDYNGVVKDFIILYPYWDFSGPFGTRRSYKLILYAQDTRVNSANESTVDLRNEGYLFGYEFPDDTVAPDPLPEYVANNAIQRLYGAVWEHNQQVLKADINVIGNNDIEPGSVVQLTNFNTEINGNWLVTEIKHDVAPSSGWTTNFKAFKIVPFTLGFNPGFDIYLEQMLYTTFDAIYG